MQERYYTTLLTLLFVFMLAAPTALILTSSGRIVGTVNAANVRVIPSVGSSNAPYIVTAPRIGFPAMVQAGQSFQVELDSSGSQQGVDAITIELKNSETENTLNIPCEASITFNSALVSVEATVPVNTPYLLYNLHVIYNITGKSYEVVEYNSVSVIREFKQTPTVIHLTDLHIGDPRGAQENIKETIGWKAAKRAVQEINILRPDFVLLTGDLVFGQNYMREYPALLDILKEFHVPVFCTMGNHDGYATPVNDGYDMWQKYIGPLYYSFDYGDLHFTMLNTYDWPKQQRESVGFVSAVWGGQIRSEQMKWISDDLAAHRNMSLYMCGHHNPIWQDNSTYSKDQNWNGDGAPELMGLISQYHVRAYLAGHVHYDSVNYIDGCAYITTTTASSSYPKGQYWGYRILNLTTEGPENFNYYGSNRSVPSYNLASKKSTGQGLNGAYTEVSTTSSLNRSYTAHCLFASAGDVLGGEKEWAVQVGNQTFTLVKYTIEPGDTHIAVGKKASFLLEDRFNGTGFFAPDSTSDVFNVIPGLYIENKKADDFLKLTINSDTDMTVNMIRFSVNRSYALSDDYTWTSEGGTITITNVRLHSGTNTILGVLNITGDDSSVTDEGANPEGGSEPGQDATTNDSNESSSRSFQAANNISAEIVVIVVVALILFILLVILFVRIAKL